MLPDLISDWISSEIPPIDEKADKKAIATHDRRIAKAQAIRKAVIDFDKTHAEAIAAEIAKQEQLAGEVAALSDRIIELEAMLPQTQIGHDWQAIVDQLDKAGFDEYLEAAVAAGVGAFGAASRMIAAVQVGDLATIAKYWQTISAKYPPKTDQLAKWDAILKEAQVEDFSFEPLSSNV